MLEDLFLLSLAAAAAAEADSTLVTQSDMEDAERENGMMGRRLPLIAPPD